MRRLPLIFAAVVLAACGTKGPLTLPPKTLPAAAPKPAQPAPVPATAPNAAPESKPATTPGDDSSKPAAGAAQ